MHFHEFGFNSSILKGVSEAGYTAATAVQDKAIPEVMKGKDIIVQAKTGSGKTAAFVLPLLQKIEGSELQAIVLVPTRELAMQVHEEIKALGRHTNVRSIPIYGGSSINEQMANLPHKQIVVATPGRYIDLFERGHIKTSKVNFLILDEADRMLDMGFEPDIRFIIGHIPRERQTVMFSATMPEKIRTIGERYMKHPTMIKLDKGESATAFIEQFYLTGPSNKKVELVVYTLIKENPSLAMIFCRTKRNTDWLGRILHQTGFAATVLHGDLSQHQRDAVMKDFKSGRKHILVATDIAARGLDVDNVSHVINYDVPDDPDTYVHRIGRTARIGKKGKAITILTSEDTQAWSAVQRRTQARVERMDRDPEVKLPDIQMPSAYQGGTRGPRRFSSKGRTGGPGRGSFRRGGRR